jgi:hypothetical protein
MDENKYRKIRAHACNKVINLSLNMEPLWL